MIPAYLESRFIPEPMSGCWLWEAGLNPKGYGWFRGRLAHRVLYELVRGPIPKDLVLDHLCRLHCCVNPDHLEAVTHKVNIMRGEGIAPKRAAQTHCIHGHPFDTKNTYYRKDKPQLRQCRECHNIASVIGGPERRRRAKLKRSKS